MERKEDSREEMEVRPEEEGRTLDILLFIRIPEVREGGGRDFM